MMKRLFFLFLILMIFLAGCSTEPEKNGENVDNKNSVERLRSYIAQSEGSSDVKAYMDQLLKGADTETSDTLVLEYLLYIADCKFNCPPFITSYVYTNYEAKSFYIQDLVLQSWRLHLISQIVYAAKVPLQ